MLLANKGAANQRRMDQKDRTSSRSLGSCPGTMGEDVGVLEVCQRRGGLSSCQIGANIYVQRN